MQSLAQAHPLEQFAGLIPAPGTPSHSQAQADGDILNCGEGCKEAVEAAYTGGVSVGVFAGGWVQERGPGRLLGPGTLAAKDVDALFWQHLLLSAK